MNHFKKILVVVLIFVTAICSVSVVYAQSVLSNSSNSTQTNSTSQLDFGSFSNATNIINETTIWTTTNSNTTFSTVEDDIPNNILQQVLQMPQFSKDASYLNIETKLHGFSGMYLDGNHMFNIFTTDPTIKSVDKSVFADYINPDLVKGIVVNHSGHSWHKWIELENILLQLFNQKDLGITMMGFDDTKQVYRIGFEKLDNSSETFMTNFLATHNIPQDMIQLIETGKLMPISGDDSTNNYAPIVIDPIVPSAEIGLTGAANQGYWSATPHCTLGLIAKTSTGTTVGITAGHCQGSNAWNTKTQQYTQPYSTTSQNSQHIYPNDGRYIGTASTTTTNLSYSDSLLTNMIETSSFETIYNGVSSKIITGKFNSMVGLPVCYTGATSGAQKCGNITLTGQTVSDAEISRNLFNQVYTNITPALGGDSGSPVYAFTNGDTTQPSVQFAGTVWCCANSNMWYSPIQGIDSDQGILTVAFPPCGPPSSGDWIISSSCTLYSSAIVPANVIVQSNSELLIPSGATLNIDFTHYHLTVNYGSSVLIQVGGHIT